MNSFIQVTATLSLVMILIRIKLALAKPSGLVFAIYVGFGISFHQIDAGTSDKISEPHVCDS